MVLNSISLFSTSLYLFKTLVMISRRKPSNILFSLVECRTAIDLPPIHIIHRLVPRLRPESSLVSLLPKVDTEIVLVLSNIDFLKAQEISIVLGQLIQDPCFPIRPRKRPRRCVAI